MTELKAPGAVRPDDAASASTAEIPAISSPDTARAATPPHHNRGSGKLRTTVILRIAGATLTGIGILFVVAVLYALVFTNLYASRAQHRLLSHFDASSPAFRDQTPAEGGPVAVLSIPALDLHVAVVEGTNAEDLEAGPGLMPDTAFPGTGGNAVIAGRRLTFGHYFAHLDRLHPGDQVQVIDIFGRFTYRVTSTRPVHPGQIDPISPTHTAQLTLITSNSSPWPTGRFVVQADLVGAPAAAAPVPKREPPSSERALSGDTSAIWQLVLWAVALTLALAATALVYLRWRQPLPTYLLSTPILLAVAALTFENAVRLLPATL